MFESFVSHHLSITVFGVCHRRRPTVEKGKTSDTMMMIISEWHNCACYHYVLQFLAFESRPMYV